MKGLIKFKMIILTPIKLVKSMFNSLFPLTVTLKCKTCGELKKIKKELYLVREESISKGKTLQPYLAVKCEYCHTEVFELFKKKKKRKIIFISTIIAFFSKIIEKTINAIIFIFGNLLAEIWKLIVKFWQEDLYIYLKTIISFFGICVGSVILSHLIGLNIAIAFALTFAFFMMTVIKNFINRRN